MCGEGGWRLSRYTIAISPAYPTDVHEHNTITSGDDSKGRFRVMANLRADLSGPGPEDLLKQYNLLSSIIVLFHEKKQLYYDLMTFNIKPFALNVDIEIV